MYKRKDKKEAADGFMQEVGMLLCTQQSGMYHIS